MNKNRNRKMVIVLVVLIALLLFIALYLAYFHLFKAKFYANHNMNARNWVDENKIARGTIKDRDGNILTYSQKTKDGQSVRVNNYKYIYSPIIGYTSTQFGKTGIEQSFNRELLDLPSGDDFVSQLEDLYKKSDKGRDLFLTIDSEVQSFMYGLLKGYSGAIVVLEPKTGDVISMVSRPTFNINKLEENWEELINSNEAVLLNRATQGLYIPGSTFKVLSSIAYLKKGVDLDYDDKGTTVIDGYKIANYNEKANGKIGLKEALMNSANTYYADKSTELQNGDFLSVTDSFMLGKKYDFDITRSFSKIVYSNKIDKLEKAASAFGQGKNLVTPLDMANVAAAIANDGKMMKPRLVYKTEKKGKVRDIETQLLSDALDKTTNDTMVEYMTETASHNGFSLENGMKLAGKSGTAETGPDTTDLWYIGFGPSDNPKYAVAIVLENTGTQNGHIAGRKFVQAMQFLLDR